MGKSYIVLHKSEWDRLHRKTDDESRQLQLSKERDDYFQKLNEISRSWTKTWPDTVEGHVQQVAKKQKMRHAAELAVVEKGFKSAKHENTKEAIKRARQLIFDNSSYGRQLLSALRESKDLEIRDLQIQFEKELKEQMRKQEKEMESKLMLDQGSFNLGTKEQEMKQRRKQTEKELGEINKSMHEMAMCKKNKLKEEQEQIERDNAELTQKMLKIEAQKKKEHDSCLKEGVDHYEKEQLRVRQRRSDREKRDEAAANAHRDMLQKRYCRINSILKEIHVKEDKEHFKINYETVKQIQQENDKRYNNFVDKGINDLEERTKQKEKNDAMKQALDRKKNKGLSKGNKQAAEDLIQARITQKHFNKCVADRTCILTKSCYKKQKVPTDDIKEKPPKPCSFLQRPNTLKEQLEARRVLPTPWGALKASHVQFAECADATLKECKYKHFARKVIDEYRTLNCLDANTLPIPNY